MDKLVDLCFCEHDIELLKGFNLKAPSDVPFGSENAAHDAAKKQFLRVQGMKGRAVQNGNKELADDTDHVMAILKVYQGVMKPKKSRLYKINSFGQFCNLDVHLPGLLSDGILKVFSNGKKVLDESVDQDTIDMLMKRHDKKRHYSELAHEIFNKLIQLNEVD